MLYLPINEQGWGLIVDLIRNFARSEVGTRAIGLAALLIFFLFGINGLNIVNSYVGRDFMTAIADRNMAMYLKQAVIYVGVFATSTVVSVLQRYAEERLGLLWRGWMTRRFVELYLQYPTYFRLNDALLKQSGIENFDQRIADDVRVFTSTTLSFTLILLNGVFTVVAFSGVLWTISPHLFGIAVLYAVAGSYIAIVLGRPLVDLNYGQLDKEASFRSSLIHLRERAESVALLHREERLLARLLRQFDELVVNSLRIIAVNRKLGFFTTGYSYLVQIIPILVVAPLFITGSLEFGVVTQSAMAFAMLVGAFSFVITQFQSLSSYAAVVERLVNLWYVIQLAQTKTVSGIDVSDDDSRVAYEELTLFSPADGSPLVKDLSISIPQGTRVLITGPEDTTEAKEALFKATAGLLDTGTGRVIRPHLDQILFLPERPYMPPGSLREALIPDQAETAIADETITATLRSLGIENVLSRAGGLDAEQDWDDILSLAEQQFISFARMLLIAPRFAFLDRPSTHLDPQEIRQLLRMLSDRNITYLVIGRQEKQDGENWNGSYYDAILELYSQGRWKWSKLL